MINFALPLSHSAVRTTPCSNQINNVFTQSLLHGAWPGLSSCAVDGDAGAGNYFSGQRTFEPPLFLLCCLFFFSFCSPCFVPRKSMREEERKRTAQHTEGETILFWECYKRITKLCEQESAHTLRTRPRRGGWLTCRQPGGCQLFEYTTERIAVQSAASVWMASKSVSAMLLGLILHSWQYANVYATVYVVMVAFTRRIFTRRDAPWFDIAFMAGC